MNPLTASSTYFAYMQSQNLLKTLSAAHTNHVTTSRSSHSTAHVHESIPWVNQFLLPMFFLKSFSGSGMQPLYLLGYLDKRMENIRCGRIQHLGSKTLGVFVCVSRRWCFFLGLRSFRRYFKTQ